jgi:hypothetical protein
VYLSSSPPPPPLVYNLFLLIPFQFPVRLLGRSCTDSSCFPSSCPSTRGFLEACTHSSSSSSSAPIPPPPPPPLVHLFLLHHLLLPVYSRASWSPVPGTRPCALVFDVAFRCILLLSGFLDPLFVHHFSARLALKRILNPRPRSSFRDVSFSFCFNPLQHQSP